MDVRELRIGNWVTHLPSKNKSTNAYFIVSEIEAFKKEFINGLDADDCEPIPLTEEWLVSFGFDDSDYKKGYIGKEYRSNLIFEFVLTKPLYMGEWQNFYVFEQRNNRFSKIDHVHQLQNLYQALTGEELTLKNNVK